MLKLLLVVGCIAVTARTFSVYGVWHGLLCLVCTLVLTAFTLEDAFRRFQDAIVNLWNKFALRGQ